VGDGHRQRLRHGPRRVEPLARSGQRGPGAWAGWR